MKNLLSITLSAALLTSALAAGEQFAMSDKDRAMYQELLEANPADINVEVGSGLVEEHCGGDAGLAKFLGVKESDLPKYLAGFPRYVEKLNMVAGIDQVMQAIMHDNGQKPFALKSKEMFNMVAYARSIANDEPINIDVNANPQMKAAFALGKEVFETKRGGRGLSCLSCHSQDVIGTVLRTQPLPDLGYPGNAVSATWPAYRMTKSSVSTPQHRFQGCMKNALLAVIPLGSPEMVALEVYITDKAKGAPIAIPGLKR